MASQSSEAGSDGFVRVATLQELRSKRQLRVQVKDRVLALFYVRGTMFALDHFCYHTGGPLALGDIEDADGRPCVICPWHKHKITLDTGESLYTAIDPKNPRNIKPNCSKGRRQRVHQIREDGEYVTVKISDPSQDQQELESDRYYTEPYRVFIENSLKEDGKHVNAVKVPIHSSRTGLARGHDLHYSKR